ncbi:hypothetical protein [Tersicoccus sp. Bi-70]|uniref:DoxX family protein n=1 Tax=Tersicoccus sp. Bi-70 TaxID=1897634 RepID=UPI000975CDEC|nr:hypothetical protein [Tersicoccus sp. Bi-70]OMH34136.1 hypothetical protein BGP79_02985 [Tersicoccus sp. Bi-70]
MNGSRVARTLGRLALGGFMLTAGVAHLRQPMRGQFARIVPPWVPGTPDGVVVASGVVELGLGTAVLARGGHRPVMRAVMAGFFVAVFPGNVHQFTHRIRAFGVTDQRRRFVRLLLQPLLVLWAWWALSGSGRRRR